MLGSMRPPNNLSQRRKEMRLPLARQAKPFADVTIGEWERGGGHTHPSGKESPAGRLRLQ